MKNCKNILGGNSQRAVGKPLKSVMSVAQIRLPSAYESQFPSCLHGFLFWGPVRTATHCRGPLFLF